MSEEHLEVNPLDGIIKRKEPIQLPKTLTKAQIEELLNTLELAFDKSTFVGLRNITMVQTFLYT